MPLIYWIVAWVSFALALGDVDQHLQCTHPRVRAEWRTLGNTEKLEYLRAVKCLFELPSRGTDYFATKTRFDDFSATHINATTAFNPNDPGNRWVVGPGIHGNGIFLAWHRHFLWLYESALINECAYTGTQPYWDWTLDNPTNNSTFFSTNTATEASPIFSTEYGFGRNGRLGTLNVTTPEDFWTVRGSCINDGPFVNSTVNLGPTYNLNKSNPHCIMRNIQTGFANTHLRWNEDVLPLLRMQDFWDFSQGMNARGNVPGIHSAGHYSVGGEMLNIWSSSNDPLFYLHHAQLDRIWSLWQSLNSTRLHTLYGPAYPNGTGSMNLDSIIEVPPFVGEDRKVTSVMNTKGRGDGDGILCYEYQEDGRFVGLGTAAG